MTYNLNSTQGVPEEGRLGSIAGTVTYVGKPGVSSNGNPFAGFSVTFTERVPVGTGYLSQIVRVWVSGFGPEEVNLVKLAEVGQLAQVTGKLQQYTDKTGQLCWSLRLQSAQFENQK